MTESQESQVLQSEPRTALAVIEEGIRLFEELGREKVLALTEDVPDAVLHPLDPTETAERFAISEDEAAAALTTLAWLASRQDAQRTLASFSESEGRQIALEATERLGKEPLKAEVEKAFRSAELANRILPSVRAVDIVVDARLDIRNGEVKGSVPVALLAIVPDVGDVFTVQMTKKQLKVLVKQIEDTIQQTEVVETWVKR